MFCLVDRLFSPNARLSGWVLGTGLTDEEKIPITVTVDISVTCLEQYEALSTLCLVCFSNSRVIYSVFHKVNA